MRRLAMGLLVPILAACGTAPSAVGSEGPPPVLNPTTYASPSGRSTLLVDPSDIHGRGGATYRLATGGKVVWEGTKPYTLWEARVTDDGVAGGYAYSHGWRGFGEGGYKAGMGNFRVVLIAPDGRERLDKSTRREDSHFLHTPPNPLAEGLLMDPADDRMIVRVRDDDVNRRSEAWWTYRISTGEALPVVRPKDLMADPEPAGSLLDARTVPGTPLLLLHWWRFEYGKGLLHNLFPSKPRIGARFTLVDPAGKAVWTLDLPDDYLAPDDQAQDLIRESIWSRGAILGADQPGRFEVRRVRDGSRVTFSVARRPDGAWAVEEVGRRPYVEPPPQADAGPAIPAIAPRLLGRIDLVVPGSSPEPPIRDVVHFAFDARGRIAFLRNGREGPALVLVDPSGEVIRAVPLDPDHRPNRGGWSGLTWVGGDRVLLIRDDPKDQDRMDAAWADVSTGRVTPVLGFSTTVLSEVAGFPDGGFVVKGGLSYGKHSATGDHNLYAFDAAGRRLWKMDGNDYQNPKALFSPHDLAATTDGKIAVLDTCPGRVHLVGRDGKILRTIDLKASWGREPNYPSAIVADRDGGFVVEDFGGHPPIVRMGPDGAVRAGVEPKFADGRAVDLRDLAVAPDGSLWVSDGHALLRVSGGGTVDRVLGEPPGSAPFREADGVTVDGRGRVYAVESRSGTVHVFGPDGRWSHACRPAPTDVPGQLSLPHLTATDAGDVYLQIARHGDGSYLHFAPDGKRLGIERLDLDSITEEWHAQRGSDRRWVLGYEEVFLVDPSGKAVRTIARRPDRDWLQRPHEASVAPDGSIAVVAMEAARIGGGGPIVVCLYSPTGEPIRSFALPGSAAWSYPKIAFDGRREVVVGEKEVVLFDASGKPLGRFSPPGGDDLAWTPFLTADGRELLLFDGRKTLIRFEMP